MTRRYLDVTSPTPPLTPLQKILVALAGLAGGIILGHTLWEIF